MDTVRVLFNRLTLRKKDKKTEEESQDAVDVTASDKEKIEELPPAALKVFKSSGLTRAMALKHWDVFLNCLYYSTPKKTFAKPPPMVKGEGNHVVPSHLSENESLSIDEISFHFFEGRQSSTSQENSELEVVHSSIEEDISLSEHASSSSLDSDFDPKFFTNKALSNKDKKIRRKKRRFTIQEKEGLVIQENPKEVYQSFREIGKGAYGKVYIAQDKKDKKKVAIKHMKRDWEEDGDSIINEIALLDSCHHVNIVNYIASYLWNRRIWMVMEYCDAGTLKQLLVIEMSEGQIANVIKQVLKGLAYLHAMNRIHRDIKSANILLNMNGEVKVADLGLCVEGEGEHSGMAGSKYWMAPEMIKRQPYNNKVDIWSLGALCVEMAEGNPPYHKYKPLKALFLTSTRGAPSLMKPDKWTDTFKEFLSQGCFEMDPTKRASAEELLKHNFIKCACDSKELIKALKLVFLMRVTAGL